MIRRILSSIVFLSILFSSFATAQLNVVAKHRGGVPPTFSTSTFVAAKDGTSLASITSPAISVTSGQFAYVYCRTLVSGITVTSSPANTFVQDPGQGAGTIGQLSGSHSFLTSTGSTTFTCTPGSSSGSMGMIVLIYNTGFLTAVDTSTTQIGNGSSSTPTTNAFTTAGPGLIIACQVAFPSTVTAGLIGATTGNLRVQTSNANAQLSCEDSIAGASQAGITASMTNSVNNSWLIFVTTYK